MSWVKVLPQDALAEGGRQVVKVGQRSILLIRHQGRLYAMDDLCPHMRGPLQKGKITEDGAIVCPWHHSAFDLGTGDVKEWSPWPPGVGRVLGLVSREKALSVFPTRISEGSIWVGIEEAMAISEELSISSPASEPSPVAPPSAEMEETTPVETSQPETAQCVAGQVQDPEMATPPKDLSASEMSPGPAPPINISQIKEHLMVYAKGEESMGGVPGVQVGTVDHVDGEHYIKLTRSDSPDEQHHWIPLAWVEAVDDKAVYLNKTPEEFNAGLLDQLPTS